MRQDRKTSVDNFNFILELWKKRNIDNKEDKYLKWNLQDNMLWIFLFIC